MPARPLKLLLRRRPGTPEQSRVQLLGDRPGRAFAWLFATLLVLFILTASGYITLSDGAAMAAETDSILHGHLDVAQNVGVAGTGHQYYSVYGLGWSVADLPLFALGLVLQSRLHLPTSYNLAVFLSSFLNPVLIAATAYFVARFVYHLASSLRLAIVLALVFALATPAWPYTKDAFSEPLVMLCLLSSTYLMRHRLEPRLAATVGAGALTGAAILTRPDAAPEAAAVLIYSLLPEQRRNLATAAAFALPVAAAGIAQLGYDAARFGSPLQTGYEQAGVGLDFHRSISGTIEALAALIASPDRGVVWFVPTAIVSALLLPTFLRIAKPEAILCITLFLIAWIEHADLLISYTAGVSWGPRFLMPILPFLILPLSAIGADCQRWRKYVFTCTSAWGLVANLSAVLVKYSRYFYASDAGLNPGPSPPLYLWSAAIQIAERVLRGDIPTGRITQLSSAGSTAIVSGATVFNSPDFWWSFLIISDIHRSLVALAVVVLLLVLAFCLFKLHEAVRHQERFNTPGRPTIRRPPRRPRPGLKTAP